MRACGLSILEFDHLAAGQRPFAQHLLRRDVSPIADLTGGYEVYLRRLAERSESLKSVRKHERRLGRAHGEVRFEWDTASEDAFAALLAWKSAQYRRSGRPDMFARPWVAQLVRDLVAVKGERFSGVLSVLRVDGEPVAAHAGIRTDRVLSLWFPAFDVRFEKFSPGMILHTALIEEAAARGIEQVDFGKGRYQHKERLSTGELDIYEARVHRATPLGLAHLAWREPLRRAERFVLDHDRLAHLARRTRERLGAARTR